MSDPTPFAEFEQYLFDPARQATAILSWIDRVKQPGYRLITTGCTELDDAVTLFPGSLTAVAGRPGMGKSQFGKHLAGRTLREIRDEGASGSECVVFVTLEEKLEMVAMTINGLGVSSRDIHRGLFDRDDLERKVHDRVTLPGLHILAHPGIIGTGKDRRLADPLTSSRILDTIARIEVTTNGRVRPRLVILDYLQLLQPDRDRRHTAQSKTEEVMIAVEGAKGIASATNSAVVMAVQASRESDGRRPPMPQLADMQWASSIEQACDSVLGVLRPIRHSLYEIEPDSGERPDFAHNGRNYPVTDDLYAVGIVKGRHDGGAGVFVATMDPRTCRMEDHPWSSPIFRTVRTADTFAGAGAPA